MSRFIRHTLAALAIGLATTAAPAAGNVLRVTYPETENPPRILGQRDTVPTDKPGISVELLRMVAAKTGLTLNLARAPWKRCLSLLENGYIDATFHASYTEERAKYAVYPTRNGKLDVGRAIYLNRYALYVKRGSALRWDGQALSHVDKPVGTLAGNAIADDLQKLGVKVEQAPGLSNNMDKLKAGQISAYAEIESIGDDFLAHHRGEFPEIEKLPLPMAEKQYFLVLSKAYYRKNPVLAEALFDAVRDIQTTPEYRKMLQKYQ
ncbi:MAG TPA: transporter substrate-binding domain-containing protein [Rhodocyclaceae bacterium]